MTRGETTWLLDTADTVAQDRPIEQQADDELDRDIFVESIARALIRETRDESGNLTGRQSTGFVVGLTGSWGAGKSSVLNLLALHLGSLGGVIVAKFNPWLFRGRDELLTAFFNELRQAMGRSNAEHAGDLIEALDRYRGAIEASATVVAAGADLLGAGGAASMGVQTGKGLWRRRKEKPVGVSIQDERASLEIKIKKVKSAVVVLVDELDRVDDEDVRSVAQLVKAVGDIKGISYLVAYDPERVADALGRGLGEERRASGYAYLEKIIQHPIPLRPLFSEDVDRLLRSALARYQLDLPEPEIELDSTLLRLIKEELSTPREIKRLIGSFVVIEEAVRGEINPAHVLAYSWLLTKASSIRATIASRLDRFVDDPTESEMSRRTISRMDRGSKKEELSDPAVLGNLVGEYESILKILFPRFSDEKTNDGTRISLRRNLVRILYLGNPPGAPSRADIEQIWGLASADETEVVLRQMLGEGSLPAFLDRLDDLLPKLPQAGDEAFWVALSRTFVRPGSWLTGPSTERALADDAATSLFRLGLRNKSEVSRVRKLIDILISNGDLIFVPWILRKLMFQHGMVAGQEARHGDVIIGEMETDALLKREMGRYRQAILSGIYLKKVPTAEALFVLKNGNMWSDDLHNSLSDQLKSFDAIQTVAGLLTPPGYVIDKATLFELFDGSSVLDRIADMPTPTDPWLEISVKRLRAILEGKDPMFINEED